MLFLKTLLWPLRGQEKKSPRHSAQDLTWWPWWPIMNIERALPADGGPYLTIEVTAWLVAGAVTSFL